MNEKKWEEVVDKLVKKYMIIKECRETTLTYEKFERQMYFFLKVNKFKVDEVELDIEYLEDLQRYLKQCSDEINKVRLDIIPLHDELIKICKGRDRKKNS